MITRIQKWGNRQGLRVSRQALADARLSVGDEVDISVKEGVIVVAPVRPAKHSLRELVSRIPRNYKAKEVGWGAPSENEEW